ncbi:hypothetical protein DEU56DRAFT_794471 [Suillus clintonianus]|uniref:uncharacterized protein n=1 Tax=Suillus clintonianus TaxID=1904413 RepID=UPI001B883332|nr:uncharacterized protein DEU56DRAFT_794471 [Suillus clintonianus]KAG2142446.1 hypothetical protein DEU56DRAFT_794471 [Suillus clintonianus]
MFHSRLRVRVGPSMDKLVCITDKVNSGKAHAISSELFEGKVAINIKGFTNPSGEELSAEYFDREDRKGITWSIQVQGRFLQPTSADDVMFGNTFDKRLKLPWGSGVALKFMKYIDPTLEHDLMSETKPWALSPLIATMPHFVHERLDDIRASPVLEHRRSAPSFPPSKSIGEDISQLQFATATEDSSSTTVLTPYSSNSSFTTPSSSLSSSLPSAASSSFNLSTLPKKPDSLGVSVKSSLKLPLEKVHLKKKKRKMGRSLDLRTTGDRRSYFNSPQHRQEIAFGPEDLITTDFCYGYLQFSPTLALRLPGGMSFDLMKYWDRHPVRFVCCKRRKPEDGERSDGQPTGDIYWIVSIETADENDIHIHQEDLAAGQDT